MKLRYFILLLLLAACHPKEKFFNDTATTEIYTADSLFTVAEAMAVKDGKIYAVGTNDFIRRYDADTVIDAKGAAVYPGFNDAHAHFAGYATSLLQVDLTGTKSWDEVLERTKAFAATHPFAWVLGRGWDQNNWPVKAFPDKVRLDSLFPTTPVFLARVDGHAAIVNQAALSTAGVKAGYTLTGGTVETRNGQLTGILVDNAVSLVGRKIPEPSLQEAAAALMAAQANCLAAGLTSITDCGLSRDAGHLLDTLQQTGKLQLRLNIMLSDNEENIRWLIKNGPVIKDRLQVRAIKFYGDGALGSRGACLLRDYTDKHGWRDSC